MKNLFTFLSIFFLCQSAFAASGIFQSYAIINANNAGDTYYHGGANADGSSNNFSGRDFMTPTSLILNGGEIKTFKNSGSDVQGGRLNYRVYKSGETAGAFTEITFSFAQDLGNGDQRWDNTTSNVDLLALATSNGDWIVEIFWSAPTNEGDIFDSNGGANYTAQFTRFVLPVELTYFEGTKRNNSHQLNWSTASEINNNYFEIQHSTNSTNWQILSKVTGAGNSSSNQSYQFTNDTPVFGQNYYRLKQVDYDGQFEFSEILNLEFSRENQWEIFPNPVANELTVKFENTKDESLTANIYHLNGQLIAAKNLTDNSLNVIDLTAGFYFLQLVDANGQTVLQKRFMKE